MATGQDGADKLSSVKTLLESVDLKLDDVRGNVTGLKGEIVTLKAEVQALKDQIAAGGAPITQEQLDSLVTGLGELEVKASAIFAEAEEAAV
jgi:phage shock protein A